MKKGNFLLAIDIGNSSTTYGIFAGGILVSTWHGGIDVIPKIDRYIIQSGRFIDRLQIIIDSVNPIKLKSLLTKLKRKYNPSNILILGRNVTCKIQHKYFKINKLGSDRIANIYGAIRRFKVRIAIVDFGTATTFDLVSGRGVFEGGLIIPGIETSWRTLQEKAALLPRLRKISTRKGLVGRNTESCMNLGVLQGFGAMTDGLISRFRARYGRGLKILVTGGLASLIIPYIKSKVISDPNHTLKSLYLIWKDQVQVQR